MVQPGKDNEMFHFHSDDRLFAIFGGGVDKSFINITISCSISRSALVS